MLIRKYPYVICYARNDHKDIVFAEFPSNLKVDLLVAQGIVASRLDFTKNEKHYVVIDFSNVKEVSTDAKKFMQQPDMGMKNILGAAFIATNPVSAMLANIFVKTGKDFQAKFFSNKTIALNWILNAKNKRLSNN